MQLKLATGFVVSIFLLGLSLYGQKGKLTVNPEIGFQIPFAKNTVNGFTKGTLHNNVIWVVPSYGISVGYHLNNSTNLNLRFLNGQAGYNMGVVHEKPCGNGYNGIYGDRWTGSSFNERRVVVSIEKKLTQVKMQKRFSTYFSLQSGIGIDFRSKEWDSSKVFMPSTNLCGEE